MFLNDLREVPKNIRARIAIFARCAVTIGAACALAQKTANARNLLRNKHHPLLQIRTLSSQIKYRSEQFTTALYSLVFYNLYLTLQICEITGSEVDNTFYVMACDIAMWWCMWWL
jgi:hypothetical protein